mgnify:CR=1 FL=1
MDNKEIILSKIAEILSRDGFFLKSNSEFKSRLKCVGLGEYFDKYVDYLIPYYYKNGNVHKFENLNEEYDIFDMVKISEKLVLNNNKSNLYRNNWGTLWSEKIDYFVKFNVDGLLRGDYQSRMNGYAVGIQNGFMSPNDIRSLENMDLIPDELGGNLYLINGAMTKLQDAGGFMRSEPKKTEMKEDDSDE